MRVAACLAFLLASAAGAQPPQPEAPSEIVVSGMRDREQQVRDFVQALTPARPGSNISRFEERFCPAVSGLPSAQAETVAARLRAVAGAVGIDVADRDCRPNALVIVTESKRALIEALAMKRPYFFGDLSQPAIRRLARSPGAASAWQLEGQLDANGVPLRMEDGIAVNRTTKTQSRLQPSARWAFDAAVLVVEARALEGATATQFADYAAMRLLARLDPSRLAGSAAPTILTMIDAPPGTAVPVTLTSWDFAFLSGLYAAPANRLAGSQRSAIARDVKEALDRPDRSDKPK